MPERESSTLRVLVAEGVMLEVLRSVLTDDRLTWAYASRTEDTGLGWLEDLLAEEPLGAPQTGERPGVALDRWEEGRAFGPDLEIDWWRAGETYRLRALMEQGEPPQAKGISWEATGEPLESLGGQRAVLLHGMLDEDSSSEQPTWSEARIPRHLAHPYAGDEGALQVVLVGCDYGNQGAVALTRLIEVISLAEQGGEQ